MQRAIVASGLVGLSAPAIGIFLVQRRLSLMGDGIGHVAFTGVALGFLIGVLPLYTAIALAVLGAIAIELLRERGRTAGDVALAVIFYGGLAAGAFLLPFAQQGSASILTYLFGNVLSVDATDIRAALAVSLIVLALTMGLRKLLFAVSYDEEVARASGVPVRSLNILIAITAAVTIGLTMRVTGILLVSAMLVLPVAAIQQLTRSFGTTYAGSLVLGFALSVGGIVAAFYLDTAPGATIVIGAIIAFVIATVASRVRAVA